MNPSSSHPSGRRLVVALVEDDVDIRETMTELLEWMGHEVHAASTGEAGAALISQRLPDLALIDIDLPDIDGYELAARVRAQVGGQRVRLVALTGATFIADEERSKREGFEAHLVKPVDLNSLSQLLGSGSKD